MTDDEKQQWVSEQIAKVRKIYRRIEPRMMRRGKRFNKMLPIRKVITISIFKTHEKQLVDKWMFDDLGVKTRRLKPYKNWNI